MSKNKGKLEVKVLNENGYNESTYATGLSMGITSDITFEDYVSDKGVGIRDRMQKVCGRLSGKGGGHDNFLTGITITLLVNAPMYWWKQMERYHWVHIIGSESVMHSITKRPLCDPSMYSLEVDDYIMDKLEYAREDKDLDYIMANLPHSFMQKKVITLNYQQLRTILKQRKNHKLYEWNLFANVEKQLDHKELLKTTQR